MRRRVRGLLRRHVPGELRFGLQVALARRKRRDVAGPSDLGERSLYRLDAGALADGGLAEDPPPASATGLTAEQHEHVTGHAVQACAAGELLLDVGQHGLDDLVPINDRVGLVEQPRIGLGEEERVVVRRPADHHTVDVL